MFHSTDLMDEIVETVRASEISKRNLLWFSWILLLWNQAEFTGEMLRVNFAFSQQIALVIIHFLYFLI
jgi:hypothetical protein